MFRLSLVLLAFDLALIAARWADGPSRVIISVRDQKLMLVGNGDKLATYPVSTSKFGLGDDWGRMTTPLGFPASRAKNWRSRPGRRGFSQSPLYRRNSQAERSRTRSHHHADHLAAWPRSVECTRLQPVHLHSRHAGGKVHWPASQLWLHSDEVARCGRALCSSAAGSDRGDCPGQFAESSRRRRAARSSRSRRQSPNPKKSKCRRLRRRRPKRPSRKSVEPRRRASLWPRRVVRLRFRRVPCVHRVLTRGTPSASLHAHNFFVSNG